MSYSSLINSPSYGRVYTLTNPAGAITIPTAAATAFSETSIILVAAGGAVLNITLPAGRYLAKMDCCLTAVAGNASVINYAQLQLIGNNTTGGNNQLLGSGGTYAGISFTGVVANYGINNIFMNEDVFFTISETTTVSARLVSNVATAGCATRSTTLATNPVTPCENKIVFYEIL